jgi:hypothetical protein
MRARVRAHPLPLTPMERAIRARARKSVTALPCRNIKGLPVTASVTEALPRDRASPPNILFEINGMGQGWGGVDKVRARL